MADKCTGCRWEAQPHSAACSSCSDRPAFDDRSLDPDRFYEVIGELLESVVEKVTAKPTSSSYEPRPPALDEPPEAREQREGRRRVGKGALELLGELLGERRRPGARGPRRRRK